MKNRTKLLKLLDKGPVIETNLAFFVLNDRTFSICKKLIRCENSIGSWHRDGTSRLWFSKSGAVRRHQSGERQALSEQSSRRYPCNKSHL